MDELPPAGVTEAKSPWLDLPITIWLLPFYSRAPLKEDAYAPLEAEAVFADEAKSGKFKGGLGTLQVLRYHDSPVGAYDEVLIVPGSFEVGAKGKERKMLRVTRIYVSERGTLWNGRKNWNIPKHLAYFTFTKFPSGRTELSLCPPNSTNPFLKVTLTSFKYIPAIPFSTNTAKWVGMDLRLAQPPLPSGTAITDTTKMDEEEEVECLCGTSEWKIAMPEIWGKTKACWVDVDFDPSAAPSEETALLLETAEDVRQSGGGKKWWPEYRPWKVGVFIEEGRMNFKDVEVEEIAKQIEGS